jgi:transcriptional regulator with XRE-family HTH domain
VSENPNTQLQNRPSVRALLAANVVLLRHAKGWSQETLAFECGLHRTFVAHVERQARNIAIDNIERIAVALGVQTHELIAPIKSMESFQDR